MRNVGVSNYNYDSGGAGGYSYISYYGEVAKARMRVWKGIHLRRISFGGKSGYWLGDGLLSRLYAKSDLPDYKSLVGGYVRAMYKRSFVYSFVVSFSESVY